MSRWWATLRVRMRVDVRTSGLTSSASNCQSAARIVAGRGVTFVVVLEQGLVMATMLRVGQQEFGTRARRRTALPSSAYSSMDERCGWSSSDRSLMSRNFIGPPVR